MQVVLELSELEAGLLTAAVCDFFHKMRASETSAAVAWVPGERYDASRSLWEKVEAVTKVGEWTCPTLESLPEKD